MANGRNIDGRRGFWRVLDPVNHAGRGEEQDNHDQYRDNRPGQLDRSTPIPWAGSRSLSDARLPNFTTAKASKLKTTTNIVPVMIRTKRDSSSMESAGVECGSKMFGNGIRRRGLRVAQSGSKEYADQKNNRARGPAGDHQPIRAHLRFFRSAQVFRPPVTAVADKLPGSSRIRNLASVLETLLTSRNT